MHSRRVLLFNGDGTTTLTAEPLLPLHPGEVRVRTLRTLVSSGTERLVLNGEIDASLKDTTQDGRAFTYPRPYGYCTVGEVTAAGENAYLEPGKRVFGFLPHATHHTVSANEVIPLPASLATSDATFIPNVETALNIVWDANVGPGSRVVLIGVGTVGNLIARLLHDIPALNLVLVDTQAVLRRIGPHLPRARCVSTSALHSDALPDTWTDGPDSVIECSGDPRMLQRAFDIAGQETRIIMGSWYGTKATALDLGAAFHRKRLTIAATPVTSLPAERKTRWSKDRQLATAMTLAADMKPSQRGVRYVDFLEAPRVYESLRGGSLEANIIFVMT